mmetsp:Transcript_17085/g.52466  ORF Transcript_17085/g.52466 Transcript_17085/m.52466 type:complete len:232 (-) Transcript_17085:882-1577(-)
MCSPCAQTQRYMGSRWDVLATTSSRLPGSAASSACSGSMALPSLDVVLRSSSSPSSRICSISPEYHVGFLLFLWSLSSTLSPTAKLRQNSTCTLRFVMRLAALESVTSMSSSHLWPQPMKCTLTLIFPSISSRPITSASYQLPSVSTASISSPCLRRSFHAFRTLSRGHGSSKLPLYSARISRRTGPASSRSSSVARVLADLSSKSTYASASSSDSSALSAAAPFSSFTTT